MRPKGITIIEAVVASSILAMASIVIVSLFINQSRLYKIQNSGGEIKMQKTVFLKTIKDMGEPASAVAASYTIGGEVRISSSSTIIFRLSSIDASGNILISKYDYAVIYREENIVYIELAADPSSVRKNTKRALATDAAGIMFRYNTDAPQNASVVTAYIRLVKNSQEDAGEVAVILKNKQL